jgi:ribosomal protein L9
MYGSKNVTSGYLRNQSSPKKMPSVYNVHNNATFEDERKENHGHAKNHSYYGPNQHEKDIKTPSSVRNYYKGRS